jgi:hypothetical protein
MGFNSGLKGLISLTLASSSSCLLTSIFSFIVGSFSIGHHKETTQS